MIFELTWLAVVKKLKGRSSNTPMRKNVVYIK